MANTHKRKLKEAPIELKWGESRLLEPQSNETFSHLNYIQFDNGNEVQFAAKTHLTNMYSYLIKNGSFVVKASNPEDIQL